MQDAWPGKLLHGQTNLYRMNNQEKIPLSILDLATIVQGDPSAGNSFKRSLAVAQHAEKLGYKRYWFAEHHNMESVASAATSVLIGYAASGTSVTRVGAGGIMLPNHAPLVIAEQFGPWMPCTHAVGTRPGTGNRPGYLACAPQVFKRYRSISQ